MRIALLIMLLATNAFAGSDGGDLPLAVQKFYKVYLEVKTFGVPTEKDRARFAPFLSGQLQELLEGAAAAERSYAKVTRGKVPPLVEGDLFTSMFEGANGFRVVSCQMQGGQGVCLVELTFIDPSLKSPFHWQDKIYLVKGPHGWVVDDIEFLGDWQFMHKGRLQGLLKRVIERGKETRKMD
jgi:hypothetical protein